jgi:Thoeris protein ThsB, TIR-like domain
MADNPFDPKALGLFDFIAPPVPKPEVSPSIQALVNVLMSKPTRTAPFDFGHLGAVVDLFPPTTPALPVSPLSAAVSDLFARSTPSTNPFSSLTGVAANELFQPFGSLAPPWIPLAPLKAAVKRRAFFSFYYDDIMRVNVVRNAWMIDHPDNDKMRRFYDSSLWESRKLDGDDAVKRLIREGVEYTSAVCVLIGTDTWLRRWVRYEIARAIVDGRGLLGVHLNSIRHHHTKTPHKRGYNPLDFMAVGKVQPGVLSTPRYYLFEKQAMPNGIGGYKWEWNRYSDFTSSVSLPPWLADPVAGYVTPLSQNATVYDYIADDGHRNIGNWIDRAAQGAGR